MGLLNWIFSRTQGRDEADEETLADRILKREMKDLDLKRDMQREELAALKLRNRALERAVSEALDPVDALELAVVATSKGKGAYIPRRRKESSPMEELGLQLVKERLTSNPMAEFRSMVREMEEMDSAARKIVKRRKGEDDDDNGMGGLLSLAKEVLPQILAQQRPALQPAPTVIDAAPTVTVQPVPVTPTSPAPVIPAPLTETPGVAVPAPDLSGITPPPASIKASLAIRQLQGATPQDGVQLLLEQAKENPPLADFLNGLIGMPPTNLAEHLTTVLRDALADPDMQMWAPVLYDICTPQRWRWTQDVHRILRQLALQQLQAAQEQSA